MRNTIVIVILAIASAIPSYASVQLGAVCINGQAIIDLSVRNNYGDNYAGLIVTRYLWGSCEIPAVVTSAPIPLPPVDETLDFDLVVPAPLANAFYLFEAKLVDDAGNQYPIATEYDGYLFHIPHDLSADGSAVAMRGILDLRIPGLYLYVTRCSDGCWGDPGDDLFIRQVNSFSDPLLAYLGGPVDITGYIVETDGFELVPEYDIYVESVQWAPQGSCGIVAVETRTWGDIKASYR